MIAINEPTNVGSVITLSILSKLAIIKKTDSPEKADMINFPSSGISSKNRSMLSAKHFMIFLKLTMNASVFFSNPLS